MTSIDSPTSQMHTRWAQGHSAFNNQNKMKRLLLLFGLLDLITLLRSYKHIIPYRNAWADFPWTTFTSCLLYFLLILSSYFLLRQSKIGLWLTYAEFPLRLAYVVSSFGFLLSFSWVNSDSYKILLWVLLTLEILRLVLTILIHKRYYYVTRTLST